MFTPISLSEIQSACHRIQTFSKVVSQRYPIHSQSGTLASMTSFGALSMGKSEVGRVGQTK